eukprot:sb/3462519/
MKVFLILSSIILSIACHSEVQKLVCRVSPAHYNSIKILPSSSNLTQLATRLSKNQTTVYIHCYNARNCVEGFKVYLLDFAKVSYTQFGLSWAEYPLVTLPEPVIFQPSDITRYYGNICAYSYSYWWWDWSEWEPHLDWLAFSGFNLVYIPTGIEMVLYRVFTKLGVPPNEVLSFFNGPAFLAWNRMGNMRSYPRPLNLEFLRHQVDLQHRITDRLSSLGIDFVVPGFAGFVPRYLQLLFPQELFANASCWLGFNSSFSCLTYIDTTSPFYQKVGDLFMRELRDTLNTGNKYSIDTFNENTPVNASLGYLTAVSNATVSLILRHDPTAIWVVQGWTFGYDPYWTTPRVQAYLGAIPAGHVLILDMFAESKPNFPRTRGWFGKPFLWTLINNFGRNTVINGHIGFVVGNFSTALAQYPNCVGFGYMPEGIGENTILLDAVLSFTYPLRSRDPVSHLKWWRGAVGVYRYKAHYPGRIVSDISQSLYSFHQERYYNSYIMYRRPGFGMEFLYNSNTRDNRYILAEFDRLLSDGRHVDKAMLIDAITVVSNLLEQLFFERYKGLISGYLTGNNTKVDLHSRGMREITTTLDSFASFLPSRSVSCYRKRIAVYAKTVHFPPDQLYRDFLTQITLWDRTGEVEKVRDYAFKMWSGVISGYYAPRWDLFCSFIKTSMASSQPFDHTTYDVEVRKMEFKFIHSEMAECQHNLTVVKLVKLIHSVILF